MTTSNIFPDVAEILADILAIETTEIEPTSRIVEDLGAESIDFLEVTFELERKFNVKIPRGKIVDDVTASLNGETFEEGGTITPAGIEALKSHMNEVPADLFKSGLKLNDIPSLFTVETLCKLVETSMEPVTA